MCKRSIRYPSSQFWFCSSVIQIKAVLDNCAGGLFSELRGRTRLTRMRKRDLCRGDISLEKCVLCLKVYLTSYLGEGQVQVKTDLTPWKLTKCHVKRPPTIRNLHRSWYMKKKRKKIHKKELGNICLQLLIFV